jgi:hypothetical protein
MNSNQMLLYIIQTGFEEMFLYNDLPEKIGLKVPAMLTYLELANIIGDHFEFVFEMAIIIAIH